jgi:integrase
MKENSPTSTVELPVPTVAQATEEVLNNFGELVSEDYRHFKRTFLEWLLTEGKDTYRSEGYSEATVKTTHYKVEEAYRWLWDEKGEYTKDLTPEIATELLDYLVLKTPHPDGYVYTFEKSLRRLFKFKREVQSAPLNEWEHEIPLDTTDDTTTTKDRFYAQEMQTLYRASMDKYSVKSYHNKNLTSEERDEIKALLAQRFEKPKSEIGPEDFKRANSWKIPSIIALTADVGLRPIEVGRIKTSWINLSNQKLIVPAEQAVKSDEAWECALSSKTVNALRNWLEERDRYEQYNDTDQLWMTKMGNPYGSGSLNRILNSLMESAEIDKRGRSLSWYSFRHGVATLWAEEEGIYRAKNQLRHKNIETTLRYTRSSGSQQSEDFNSLW